jgi:polysaccharide pyruvyl transferase WcaK-like protein
MSRRRLREHESCEDPRLDTLLQNIARLQMRRASDMKPNGSPRSILVCTVSGWTADRSYVSVGDEALTEWLMRALRNRFPGIDVKATFNLRGHPAYTLPPDRVSSDPRSLFRSISQADLVIVGGGTLLQDVTSEPRFPVSGLLRFVGFACAAAKICGVPVLIAGVGAESLKAPRARLATRAIVREARAVSVRDAQSASLIASVSGRVPVVGADVMFLDLDDLPVGEAVTEQSDICVSLRADAPPQLLDDLATVLKNSVTDNAEVVLVAMDRRPDDDAVALEGLTSRLGPNVRVRELSSSATWQEIYGVLGRVQLCIGMRLHFLIFAVLARCKTVALTSSPKSVSFAAEVGLSHTSINGSLDELQAAIEGAICPSETAIKAFGARAERMLEPVEMLLA